MARLSKATYSIYLTPSNVDNLRPFFNAAGISISSFIDTFLTSTYKALSSTSLAEFSKPVQDLTLREIYDLAKVMDASFKCELESKCDPGEIKETIE